jgi:hypothetical protein
MVDENGEELEKNYPQCYDKEYTIKHFFAGIMPGQTTTLMTRNYMINDIMDTTLILYRYGPGDQRLYFSLILNGRIFCMDDIMSAYRYVTSGGTSFSANNKYVFEKLENTSHWGSNMECVVVITKEQRDKIVSEL